MTEKNLTAMGMDPVLLEEWNYEKNTTIDPQKVNRRSRENVWWKCKKGHEWETRIYLRAVRGHGCPYCRGTLPVYGENDLLTLYPHLQSEFHPSKNGSLQMKDLKESSGKKVWWICSKGHEWKTVVNLRTKRGCGCPICSGKKIVQGINDFQTLFPALAKEVHPTKNKSIDLTRIAAKSSKQQILWTCEKGHEYKTSIAKRTVRGDGCPFCSGHRPIKGETDLMTKHLEVIPYWDYSKNGSPEEYSWGSGQMVNWRCEEGHSWKKTIINQVRYNSCPYCTGRRLVTGKNDIATVYPELLTEWDSEKNRVKPEEEKASVRRKYWWKCDKGHSFRACIRDREKKKKCPYCAGRKPVCGENDLASRFPELVSEWNYKKTETRPNHICPNQTQRFGGNAVKDIPGRL